MQHNKKKASGFSEPAFFISDEVQLANRFKRFMANWINLIFLFILFSISVVAYEYCAEKTKQSVDILLYWLLSMTCYLFVQLVLMKYYGQTLGKHLLDLTVVSQQDYRRLPYWRYILRELLDILFCLLQLPFLVSLMMMLKTKQWRSLSDMCVSSVVIEIKNKR